MKITTRIIFGYGLFIVILVGMAIYQLIIIHRMQSINRTLRETNFRNAVTCLQALRDQERIEEYIRKSFALADPDYLKPIKEFQKDYESKLVQLGSNAVSAEERAEIGRLERMWHSFAIKLRQLQQNPPGEGAVLPQDLQEDFESLQTQTYSVYQSGLRSMGEEVEMSRKTSDAAALILGCSVFAALSISILVSFFIFRSISNPLTHLTEGTRAIAEGKFYYRLDTSRNDEFAQLAKDFNTMTRRLNELDEMKKDFVSHVSHELKAPLVSMQETIQLLLGQIPGPLTEKQRRLLELNLQSGQRLTSMIGNLLDLSKIEAGVIDYEMKDQNLIPLVQNAIAEIEVHANEKQVQIETAFPDEPLLVECDGGRIMQVIVNLVGNAVKFSSKKGIVRIGVEAVKKVPETMPGHMSNPGLKSSNDRNYGLVTVADFGVGVPDSEKDKIFEKFYQVKKGKRIAGQGVGLGLAISRNIVDAHRGAIWVEDNPSGGSRFRLLLQAGKAQNNVHSTAADPVGNLHPDGE
ncbi:MAG: HAMP domain-containing histidine kinase [Acidobacteria bacterium]|nr:HAMP domain-containing histidine kinase [Acidobacteriota bacterium]